MQQTLFSCGVEKKIKSSAGRIYDVTSLMPSFVERDVKKIKCDACNEEFKSKQYLDLHILWKHKENINADEVKCTSHSGPRRLLDLDKDNFNCDGHKSQNTADLGNSRIITHKPSESEKVSVSNRRGRTKRKSYTVEFKVKTLAVLDKLSKAGVKNKWKKVADERGLPDKSLVIKWNKNRSNIINELKARKTDKDGSIKAARQKRHITHNALFRRESFPKAAQAVVAEFKERRQKGAKVSKLWFCQKMKTKVKEIYGAEKASSFKASQNWFQRFKKRYHISWRKRTNKKKESNEDCLPSIQHFHRSLLKTLKTKRRRDSKAKIDPKWGRWLPKNRYNVDQVPLPFINDQDKTYEIKGADQVWVSQPSSGLDKRQATLQLCIRATGSQTVKPAIVFRGKGKVSPIELSRYNKRVDVYFQEKGWMDKRINDEWTERTLIPGMIDKRKESVMFADNVYFQTEEEFHEALRTKCNTVVYMLPENRTHKIQPIDAGVGWLVKKKIGNEMEKWLEVKENLDKWHDHISAKERRILLTKWLGQAWEEVKKYKGFLRKSFERTGCLMAIDGSTDNLIRPQGLKNYRF